MILKQNNEKTVKDKNRLSQPRLDGKRTFLKKWLIFSKPQLLTENGVGPKKSLSTPNNEKYSSGKKTSFYT